MATARHRWLIDLTHIPSTSGHEHRVIDWVKGWVDRRDDLRLTPDAAGNLLITVKGRKSKTPPVIAAAHMDHPGFVAESVSGREVTAVFRGGVMEQYFDGAAVEFFDFRDRSHPGKVVSYDADHKRAEVQLKAPTSGLGIGAVGRWRFAPPKLGVKRGMLHAPACDDLAGVAAALTALDQARRKPELRHFGVLLTRAEEEGLLGAISAARTGTCPDDARILSIETSRSFPESPIGGGPIIRVGDASTVFDSALTNRITEVVKAAKIPYQRKLMAGGTCEATAFVAYGLSATGLCLALGNYHNQADIDGVKSGSSKAVLAPEIISLDDFDGLVSLMLAVAKDLDSPGTDIRSRLDSAFDSRSHYLH
ncbi:MAG: M20/M25/M40 family metallo-hydrolase [Acidimicrobiia bacterium]|nr:M20/M25/M40 family metallo-hydrolase [Acidimicrobiia bacterium]